MNLSEMKGYGELLECPYNKSHQIMKERFQTHLVKCRRSHQDNKMVKCPFNSTHLIQEPELNYHVTVCVDRSAFDTYRFSLNAGKPQVLEKKQNDLHEPIETTENWDNLGDAKTYEPSKYASEAAILRHLEGGTPSQKLQFKIEQRKKLQNKN